MDPYENPINGQQPESNEQPPNSGSSYVYVENSWQADSPAPGRPPHKRSHIATGSLIAVFIAVVLVFSALTGGLVYTLMNGRNGPAATTDETTAVTTDSSETSATTAGTEPGSVNNKHFSLADAATRKDGKALSIIDIAAQGKPAVVAINTQVSMQDMFGQPSNFAAAGSGFIISKDGYIVTNNHVIADATTITVVLDDGRIFDAKLVGTDTRNDVAVIKVDAANLPTVILGNSDDLEVGELAVAIGNPLGELSGTVTAGIISALDREITVDGQSMRLLQTDAAINAGNSGGALFNSFGDVIAINTAKTSSTGVEGLGFAIPINKAKPIIESLINYGYVRGRTKIGITTRDISAQMAEYYNMTEGIYIYDIEAGSAAAKAGLKKEDIIIAVNGQKVLTTSALSDFKEKLSPGETIKLTIVRSGKQMDIEVVLQEDVPNDARPASTVTAKGGII